MNLWKRLFGKSQGKHEPEFSDQAQEIRNENGSLSTVPSPEKTPEKQPIKQTENETSQEAKLAKLTPWRTFSFFISSTFADMQAERDHLKQIVFPRVEEELQKRRIKLEIVDLRWGVDTASMAQEDEREASILKVCLDEIKRCRPFFISLLGSRYGWVPPEESMNNAVIGKNLVLLQKGKSVTALEIEFGVLACKDQLVRSLFYFREPLPYEKFSSKRAAMFSDEYNSEINEAEKQERKSALENLKISIREHFEKKNLLEKVKTYRGCWDDARKKVTELEAWGETVFEDILSECKAHAEATWDKVPQNWKEQELALLDAFIEGRAATFCGLNKLLIEIKEHLLSKDKNNWGMVLTGESGSGKSSVFAKIKKTMDKEACFVLAHSAGLSPRAKKVLDLLLIWNRQLSQYLGIKVEAEVSLETDEGLILDLAGLKEKSPKPEIEKIQDRFRELLFTVAKQRQVVLLVDALDRFEQTERARFMTWLPTIMPGNIRLLCTGIAGAEDKAIKYHSDLFTKSIDYFTETEAREMLLVLCRQQSKTLPQKVEKIILEKRREDGQRATTSPLWLSLAVNMMMSLDHDDFEKICRLEGRGDQQIESYMADMALDFEPLPGPLFISLVTKAGQVFGENFTNAVFNYLACSRKGLREKDLEKLLQTENIRWDPLQFAGLRRWFKAHLVIQGEEFQWNLAHSILRSELTQHLGETQLQKLHSKIATHLLTLVSDPLKASETMYHLIQAERKLDAAFYYGGTLTDEEIAGATTVLAETITTNEKGAEAAQSFPSLVADQHEIFHGLLKRYISDMNGLLAKEGNLNPRLYLLDTLWRELTTTFGTCFPNIEFGRDTGLLIELLGELYRTLGNFNKALVYFNKGISLFKELYEKNQENESLKIGLAVSLHKLGIYYQLQCKFDQALVYLNNEVSLFEELYGTNPQNELIMNMLAKSYGSLSSYYGNIMKPNQALGYSIKANKLSKELYENAPKEKKDKDGLANSFVDMGTIYQQLGNLDLALKYYKKGVDLIEELYENDPINRRWKEGLAILNSGLGMIYQELGNFDLALEYFIKDNVLVKELYENDQKNRTLKESLATSFENLGQIYEKNGQVAQALEYYNKTELLFKELYENNPENEYLEKSLLALCIRLGRIYKELGNFDQALEYYKLKSDLLNKLYERNHKNNRIKVELAVSFSDVGDIYCKLGNLKQALVYYNNYHELIKELYEINPNEETHLKALAVSYEMLGATYLLLGKLDQALVLINEADEFFRANGLTERLGTVITRHQLTHAFAKIGNFHKAAKSVLHAITYHPEWSQWHYELLETLSNSGYGTNINKVIEKLTTSELDNTVLWYILGMSYQTLGKQEKAVASFRKGIEKEPTNAVLYYNLGNSLDILGDRESCIQYQHQAVAYSSTLAEPHFILGILYMKANRFKESKKHFERFLQLGKPYHGNYIAKAKLYLNNLDDSTPDE